MSETAISIAAMKPADQFEALHKSRLSKLITDKGLLSKICEAAVHLLADPKIAECDEPSILGALYKAATMGFRLERDFGECHLIPRRMKQKDSYGNDLKDANGKDVWKSICSFQIGYKGWKALALQSGHILFLEAREVYKEDHFSFKHGTAAFLDHEPAETNQGEMTHFYALCKLKTGDHLFSVINFQQAEKSRRFSEQQYREEGTYPNKRKVFEEKPVGIWAKNYAPMALRVPIKKLCSALPLTATIENAIQSDGAITYVQKDGTVTTIAPADVEAAAEQPQDQDVLEIPASIDLAFYDNQAALSSFSEFPDLLKLWKGQDEKSEAMQFRPYVKMFYDAAAKLAASPNDLNNFHNAAPKSLQKDQKLFAILSARNKALTNG